MKLCNLIEGLQIVACYELFGNGGYICAEHDEIFTGTDVPMNENDARRMEQLGFHRDDSTENGWHAFV
jgi:hypothetical protein